MADEKHNNAADAAAAAKEVVVTETVAPAKGSEQEPAEDPKKSIPETTPAAEPEDAVGSVEVKRKHTGGVSLAVAFKEETNLAFDLPEPEKKVLDELKQLLHSALANGDFSPPPAPPSKASASSATAEEKQDESPAAAAEYTKTLKPDVVNKEAPSVEKVKEKDVSMDDDGAKTVEAIAETVVPVTAPGPPSAAKLSVDENAPAAATPLFPEVLIWGVPLLGDERSDAVLLKFLRARDFKAKEAMSMIKNAVTWRRNFGIDGLLQENLCFPEMEKIVFMSGVDRAGHPVCYNAYGELQNREIYVSAFSDEEKQQRFLRWRIQYLEKGIRQLLDFKPGGISTMVQVTDLKNSPGPLKRELRQALGILLDNYPEFVERQVFINVPWWYLAFNRMISPFLTQRTKSKFVFAGPSKSAETLFRYIAPEQIPLQFGGLLTENDQDFTIADAATEFYIKPSTKQIIEVPVAGQSLLVWELRVLGWDVSYSAEFVPNSKESYTIIVHKARKMVSSDVPLVKNSFKACEPGKVLFTVDNTSNKTKMLLCRYKIKNSESS